MALFRKRRSPFEGPVGWRKPRRAVRNIVVIVVALILLTDVAGEPFLRWEYRYRGRQEEANITHATYVGFSRRFEAYAGQYGEGCPLVLFIHREPPLWKRMLLHTLADEE